MHKTRNHVSKVQKSHGVVSPVQGTPLSYCQSESGFLLPPDCVGCRVHHVVCAHVYDTGGEG